MKTYISARDKISFFSQKEQIKKTHEKVES